MENHQAVAHGRSRPGTDVPGRGKVVEPVVHGSSNRVQPALKPRECKRGLNQFHEKNNNNDNLYSQVKQCFSYFSPSPFNVDGKLLTGRNPVRNTCTHDYGTNLYKFTCFISKIYF